MKLELYANIKIGSKCGLPYRNALQRWDYIVNKLCLILIHTEISDMKSSMIVINQSVIYYTEMHFNDEII